MLTAIYSLITGRISGWRAKVLIVLLIGVVGLGIWARMEPRSVARGTWDINPGEGQTLSLDASGTVAVKVECVPTAGGDAYVIYLVDEANEARLDSENSEGVETMASVEGSGPLTLPPTTVTPGKYYVVVENLGQGRLSVKYRVFQMRP